MTSNSTLSQSPHLGVSGGGVVIMAFQDEVDGNDEVYSLLFKGVEGVPVVERLEPDNGPVGTVVKVVGWGLLSTRRVTVGGQEAEFFVVSDTELSMIIPQGGGRVSVTTGGGSSSEEVVFRLSTGISVGSGLVDFGSAESGEVLEARVIRIRNLGNRQLRITGVGITGTSFLLDSPPSFPAGIAPGGTLPLRVKFLPRGIGAVEGSLSISSDDLLQPILTVGLKGQSSALGLQLKAPQGGEKLRSGKIFVIEWEAAADFVSFDLFLSIDGGRTFDRPITSGLAGFNRSFIWSVPFVKSKTARVEVIAKRADGRVYIDQSRGDLKIK